MQVITAQAGDRADDTWQVVAGTPVYYCVLIWLMHAFVDGIKT